MDKKPILITGSHRSGTTWVGKMIAKSPEIAYIKEPFSLKHRPGICGAKFDFWFPYINKENEELYAKHIENTLKFDYNYYGEIKKIKKLGDIKVFLRDSLKFKYYSIKQLRPLIKDPIALLSSEWLHNKYNFDVIVLIRNPYAFAASLKLRNWNHSFNHFLKQPLLIKDHLYSFEDEIKEYAKKDYDIVDQAILLWRILHLIIFKFKKKHPDWIFLRHEEVSLNPIEEFKKIFEKLDLDFCDNVKHNIIRHSNYNKTGNNNYSVSNIKRNSRGNLDNWKKILTESEIARIKDKTCDICHEFYPDCKSLLNI